ncbi:hypothetical protein C8034_v006524 [Colletotrichum sidae]|uniref:Uncharacterized protein n=1 Tax=Colletotrichum sidae TaxID=1347389 RepID=A0A4R8TUC1_9PEZI|nr:hypothetical protein C8034_v006524 [Colletotrichum sidae]
MLGDWQESLVAVRETLERDEEDVALGLGGRRVNRRVAECRSADKRTWRCVYFANAAQYPSITTLFPWWPRDSTGGGGDSRRVVEAGAKDGRNRLGDSKRCFYVPVTTTALSTEDSIKEQTADEKTRWTGSESDAELPGERRWLTSAGGRFVWKWV